MIGVGSYMTGLGIILFLYQFCAGFPPEYKFKIKALKSCTHICWVTTKVVWEFRTILAMTNRGETQEKGHRTPTQDLQKRLKKKQYMYYLSA